MKITGLLFVSALMAGSLAQAGGSDRGGGLGGVCRDPANPKVVQSSVLADIYAYEVENSTEIPRVPFTGNEKEDELTVTRLMKDATDKVEAALPTIGNAIFLVAKNIQEKAKSYPAGVGLAAQPDIGPVPIPYPAGCPLEHVGYYMNNQLRLVTDVYGKLPLTDRAMFWIHEAIYKIMRIHSPEISANPNSTTTRELVGLIAAGGDLRRNKVAKELGAVRFVYFGGDSTHQPNLSVKISYTGSEYLKKNKSYVVNATDYNKPSSSIYYPELPGFSSAVEKTKASSVSLNLGSPKASTLVFGITVHYFEMDRKPRSEFDRFQLEVFADGQSVYAGPLYYGLMKYGEPHSQLRVVDFLLE